MTSLSVFHYLFLCVCVSMSGDVCDLFLCICVSVCGDVCDLFLCVCVSMCRDVWPEHTWQELILSSYPMESQGLNSGCQTWWQVPFFTHVTGLSCHPFETGPCSVAQVGLGFGIGTLLSQLLPQPSQVFHIYMVCGFLGAIWS